MTMMQIETDINGIKTLIYSVEEALRVWPGGNPGQQVELMELKVFLQRCLLELTMDFWQKFLKPYIDTARPRFTLIGPHTSASRAKTTGITGFWLLHLACPLGSLNVKRSVRRLTFGYESTNDW